MSEVMERASALTPEIEWTGRSDIHVSLAWGILLPSGPLKSYVKMLKGTNFGEQVASFLFKRFGPWEFLLGPNELANRVYVDLWRHATGQGDTQEETKLKNPETGNVFHRIALQQGLVGGLRVWLEPLPLGGPVALGFRFRVQALDEAEETVRQRIIDRAAADVVTMNELAPELELNDLPSVKVDVESAMVYNVENLQ